MVIKLVTKCPICNDIANGEHHILPRSEGGSNEQRNKVWLCSRCHNIVEQIYQEESLSYSPILVKRICMILNIGISKIISNKPRWTGRISLNPETKKFFQLIPIQIIKQENCQCRYAGPKKVKLLKAIQCKFCGVSFVPSNKQQIYCSKKCSKESSKLYYRLKYPSQPPRCCAYCGNKFSPCGNKRIYCSHKCGAMAYYKRHNILPPELRYQPRICLYCGEEFLPYIPEHGKGGMNRQFCSSKCRKEFSPNKIFYNQLEKVLFNPLTLQFSYREQEKELAVVK